jgi:uncharacterized protein (TIGR00369 family)
MCATLGFLLVEASDGYARFDGVPEFRHYNPIGTVHGGFAATLLDSALGCAIFTTLAKGEAWTTLELKLNLVRPIHKDTGTVLAEGRIIHRGRTVATAGGTVKDKAGRLYAHATTTCMVFPGKPRRRKILLARTAGLVATGRSSCGNLCLRPASASPRSDCPHPAQRRPKARPINSSAMFISKRRATKWRSAASTARCATSIPTGT